jgi:hypothetical protein
MSTWVLMNLLPLAILRRMALVIVDECEYENSEEYPPDEATESSSRKLGSEEPNGSECVLELLLDLDMLDLMLLRTRRTTSSSTLPTLSALALEPRLNRRRLSAGLTSMLQPS